ncbi:myosin heavy chain, non-muscle-like isoform X2 [Zootermopsis nevadensis]|uniref:Myosin heavy chain, non-muscle n=1 Tax=Zootermopsis nevadensis TaxID=136037 RepID=A0A067R1K5_ZOONE|nr:myosin heavy chain, non-muscle-like isoform X2 [Zootermopsis nevadensis]KDR16822.1 Myosin heavy chain, non-muscle [Zootermopsis nevadensis]
MYYAKLDLEKLPTQAESQNDQPGAELGAVCASRQESDRYHKQAEDQLSEVHSKAKETEWSYEEVVETCKRLQQRNADMRDKLDRAELVTSKAVMVAAYVKSRLSKKKAKYNLKKEKAQLEAKDNQKITELGAVSASRQECQLYRNWAEYQSKTETIERSHEELMDKHKKFDQDRAELIARIHQLNVTSSEIDRSYAELQDKYTSLEGLLVAKKAQLNCAQAKKEQYSKLIYIQMNNSQGY